jgi:hypothetical protein
VLPPEAVELDCVDVDPPLAVVLAPPEVPPAAVVEALAVVPPLAAEVVPPLDVEPLLVVEPPLVVPPELPVEVEPPPHPYVNRTRVSITPDTSPQLRFMVILLCLRRWIEARRGGEIAAIQPTRRGWCGGQGKAMEYPGLGSP